MSIELTIELTIEQAEAITEAGEELVVIDPQTKQAYRLVREEVFRKMQALLYDDSPWAVGETGVHAGEAFGKLDDTDYSEYLDAP